MASIQVSSGDKSKDINLLAHRTIGTIEVQEIRLNNPMVLFLEKGIQKESRTIVLRAVAYNDVRQRTIPPIQ